MSKIRNQFLWMFSGAISQAVMQLLITIVLVRVISVEEFGVVSAVLVVIAISKIFIEVGVGQALVRLKNIDKQDIGTAYFLSLIFAVTLSVILSLSSSGIAALFKIPELYNLIDFVIVIISISVINSVSFSILQRNLEFKKIALTNSFSYVFGYGLTAIFLAGLGYGYLSIVYAQIVQVSIQLCLYVFYTRKSLSFVPQFSRIKYFFDFGGWFTLARLTGFIATQVDNVIVSNRLGVEQLGIYGRVYQVIMMPTNLIGSVVEKVAYPNLSKLTSDKECLQAVEKAIELLLLITVPVSILITLNSNLIIYMLLGNGWEDAVKPLSILSCFLFFRVGYKLFDSFSKARGYLKQRAYIAFVFAVSVILSSLLLSSYGITGVSLSVGLSTVLYFFLMMRMSYSNSGMSVKAIILKISYWLQYFVSVLVIVSLLKALLSVDDFFVDAVVYFLIQIVVMLLCYRFLPRVRQLEYEVELKRLLRKR